MPTEPRIHYYGWSALALETEQGRVLFDPFYRRYCGVQWFGPEVFDDADLICVTHGHEEHFLDVPEVARRSDAVVAGPRAVSRFLRRRTGLAEDRLLTLEPGQSADWRGLRLSAFPWQHRDINLWKALTKAVFQGNATQLAWAWSSATRAPFYAPYTGYHVELPGGMTVLNYNEGFNSKMTDAEIEALGARLRTDVLLAGMQLDFVDDVARGAAALRPRQVLLYPPHEHFHAMMGARSAPWEEFAAAVRARLPEAQVVIAEPGTTLGLESGKVSRQPTPQAA